jgi:GAF domain-containing protein
MSLAGPVPIETPPRPAQKLGRRPVNFWLLPSVIFVVLAALTLALWQAEIRIVGKNAPRSPAYVLGGGLCISLLMSIAVLQVLLHRFAEQERTQRQLEAIERLNALSTAISAQISSGKALDELAESSRQLLSMGRAGVCLVEENGQALRIIAFAGDMPAQFADRFDLALLPACRHCLETNTIIFDCDIRTGARPYNVATLQMFEVVGMVLIPLRLENKPIGLLSLSSSTPCEFTDLDRRVAQLLASQASVILSNAQLYNQMKSALESQSRLLRQREALSEANAAVRSNASIDESLRQIARLVPVALGADYSGVSLVTGPNLEMVLVAASPPHEHLVGLQSGPSALSEQAFRERQPVIVSDAHNDSRVHPNWKKLQGMQSILCVPMFTADQQPMGILSLARKQTGTFSHEQIELIQTFSALAAVATENARLLEQTRHDAQAKTELLRELNHRVKNNLTGIVALLQMDAPQMPQDVAQWLKRVTDRIRVMAGAHQLFTGEMQRVTLEALVAQTLATVAISKPPAVQVQTEMESGRLTLGTEQAVGLAMILHELCYNALVHGLRNGGMLTIRSRALSNGSNRTGNAQEPAKSAVMIEVINDGISLDGASDNGNGVGPPQLHPDAGSGHGLGLVGGLVRRELKGKFSFRPQPGGAVATVEFPLGDGNA